MKQIPVEKDTRSTQKFTKEKLDTMKPSDIAAVASDRGYALDPITRRITHDSFLEQQEKSEAFADSDSHTESGDVPDDFPVDIPKSFDAASTFSPSTQGSVGGLAPNAPGTDFATEPLGEQSSELDHTGHQEGGSTHGAVTEPQDVSASAPTKPLVNVPVEGQRA